MKRAVTTILIVIAAAGCGSRESSVATYGPPPPVREPTPSVDEEFRLIVGDALTEQEQADLARIREVTYEPPPDASPPELETGLADLIAQESTVLIDEKIGYDIPVVLNDRVEWWIDYFTTRIPDSFQRYMIRSGMWLPYLERELREAGLPVDLVYLSMIESGFSTTARSRAGAVGPWQFMPYTGREYGLRIDRWVDERRDVEASTRAAIAYLSDLHAMFGSWYLAAAGYNGGQGRVGRAMLRDNTINFWELTDLHNETRNYVPKLLAATIIAKEPERYGFADVPYLEPVEWETVTVPTSTDLEVIAGAAEVSEETIRLLNPHLLRGRTPPGEENFPVKVPAGSVETFYANFMELPPEERTRPLLVHRIRRGETLSGIASAYGVAVREIMEENGLRGTRIRAGDELLIPGRSAPAGSRPAQASSGSRSGASSAPQAHRVRRGDTLIGIARRYGVTVTALKEANGLGSDRIRAGQTLVVP